MHYLELAVLAALIVGAIVGGYLLATHQHVLAVEAASVITRATTVPSADVAKINSVVAGLGDKVAAQTVAIGALVANAATASASVPPVAPA
jgi:hypothetical protein